LGQFSLIVAAAVQAKFVDFKNTGSILAQKGNLNIANSNAISKQTAFQKCWAARCLLSMEAVVGIRFIMVATIKTAIKTPRSLHLKAKDHVSYVIPGMS
jgi:hypothetical protein